jgi:hypothetical protein
MVNLPLLTLYRNMDQAIEEYFTSHHTGKDLPGKVDMKKCVELFERFATKGGIMN